MNRTTYALCLLVLLALAIAGCGGGDDGPSEGAYGLNGTDQKSASESDGESGIGPVKVFRADTAEFKQILFTEDGHTLYRFDRDKGSESTCYGACAKQWPPLLTEGQPIAYAVIPSKLGTTERKDGTTQATYFGHPLYSYVGDQGKTSGTVTGNGVKAFGGTWHALHKNGQDLKQ